MTNLTPTGKLHYLITFIFRVDNTRAFPIQLLQMMMGKPWHDEQQPPATVSSLPKFQRHNLARCGAREKASHEPELLFALQRCTTHDFNLIVKPEHTLPWPSPSRKHRATPNRRQRRSQTSLSCRSHYLDCLASRINASMQSTTSMLNRILQVSPQTTTSEVSSSLTSPSMQRKSVYVRSS